MLGACLCGAVQIDVEVNSEEIAVCHCSMCRTWGGGPALTVESTQKIKLTGQQFVRKYDSSELGSAIFLPAVRHQFVLQAERTRVLQH